VLAIAWWFYRRLSGRAGAPGRHERATARADDTDPEGRPTARRP
jgi:hypothetical protein